MCITIFVVFVFRFVQCVTDALDRERTKKKKTNNEILMALEKLESKVSGTLKRGAKYTSNQYLNRRGGESAEQLHTKDRNNGEDSLNTTWPLASK